MAEITKTQVNTWLKANVAKEDLAKYMQGFADCVDVICNLTKDSKPAELKAVLEKLKAGCKAMTKNYCRKLINKAATYDIIGWDKVCPLCPIYNICIQNPKNQVEGNVYYHIIELWKILEKYENAPDKIKNHYLKKATPEIVNHIKGVKQSKTQAQLFQDRADKWGTE